MLHAPTGAEIKTVVETGTSPAHTIPVVAGDFVPDVVERWIVEVGARTIGGHAAPLGEAAKVGPFVVGKEMIAPGDGILHTAKAEIVGTSFDEDGAELERDHGVQQRQVLTEQLFLKADCAGRNHDPPRRGFVRGRVGGVGDGEDAGDEVGVAFPDAGARLDDEMVSVGESFGDGVGHRDLLGSMLVIGRASRDQSPGPQRVVDGKHPWFSESGLSKSLRP